MDWLMLFPNTFFRDLKIFDSKIFPGHFTTNMVPLVNFNTNFNFRGQLKRGPL